MTLSFVGHLLVNCSLSFCRGFVTSNAERTGNSVVKSVKARKRYRIEPAGDPKAIRELGEKLGLQAFQREFNKFLRLRGLNESICDGNWWFAFLYHYSRVIQDCPLVGETKSDWKFDRVVLFEPDITDADRLDMHWEFSLGGESVGLWSAYHYL